MRNVMIILHGEPLEATLTDEQWTEYSRQEFLDSWRAQEWRRKRDELNGAVTPPPAPPVRGIGGAGVLVWGCGGGILGIGIAFGLALALILKH